MKAPDDQARSKLEDREAQVVPTSFATCSHDLGGLSIALAVLSQECCSTEALNPRGTEAAPEHVRSDVHHTARSPKVRSCTLEHMCSIVAAEHWLPLKEEGPKWKHPCTQHRPEFALVEERYLCNIRADAEEGGIDDLV